MRTASAAFTAAGASALVVVVALPARAAGETRPPNDSTTASSDVPPGYFRDAHGRLLQTEFDMNRRLWLGGGWAPSFDEGQKAHLGQAEIDIGVHIDAPSEDGRWRGRFHLLDGQVEIGPSSSARGTLFFYDESRRVDDPILRVSTFWPRPVRHDLFLSLGYWAELLTVEARPEATPFTRLRPVATGATWDIWHGRDLRNFFRLRLGAGVDDGIFGGKHAWSTTGIAALELDVIVDRAGFHHLTTDVGVDAPISLQKPYPIRTRASAGVGYEVILLAINDQPLTFRVAGRGGYRNDLPSVNPGVDAEGNAGLRINLWAPPPEPPKR
jgi:hypothetical protein